MTKLINKKKNEKNFVLVRFFALELLLERECNPATTPPPQSCRRCGIKHTVLFRYVVIRWAPQLLKQLRDETRPK